ncbi:histidinol dehydrogenase [Candidatus Amarolinea aalborgensis]|jgi:histidinol dehydrogenase|uniref:histidinol dehydrogenase n=1 Tax=Candidatus Amarolinea aalborgensis TaxID=2249329 RepID=UPI003BF9DE4F
MAGPLIPVFTDLAHAQQTVLRRAAWDDQDVPDVVRDGIRRRFGEDLTPTAAVTRVLNDVRRRGEAAAREWTQRIDGVTLATLTVSRAEQQAALARLPAALVEALRLARERIEAFHRKQPMDSWMDAGADGVLGQLIRPLDSVGVYVPGGTAPLPSSLLMAAVPARVAGVQRIVAVTPPDRASGRVPDVILAAAALAGVDELWAVGGAQAIGLLAYGGATLHAVDKIVGPGGLFVTLAKRQVYGVVGIDGIPGPTETMVIADANARPALVAADLLAQAEHDVLASAILLTPSPELATAVQLEIGRQIEELSRADIIAQSLSGRGGIVITESLAQAVTLANAYAPEHLCLLVADPWALIGQVRHAGGIFLGEGSFEVLGDYVAGPSHIMPTEGSARFASPLSVADFVKRISLIGLSLPAGQRLSAAAAVLAEAEGLSAHAAAAGQRMRGD